MSFQFPASPTEGQIFAPAGGPQYVYKAPYWRASGRVDTIIAETPPVSPKNGQLWFNSATGNTYIWYEDPNSAQWVQINIGVDSGGAVTPEAFGAHGDGVIDDTTAIELAAADAVSSQRALLFAPGATYLCSQLDIPADCTIIATGAVFRVVGNLAGAALRDITIGANCSIDEFKTTRPVTGTNAYWLEIGDGTRIGRLLQIADARWVNGFGVLTTGQDVKIGSYYCKNVDKPFEVSNNTTTPTTGFYLGYAEIVNYLRGIYLDRCNDWSIGGYHISGPATGAPVTAPGHNGILIGGCARWNIGDGYIGDANEHAFRIGGSYSNLQTLDFQVGQIYVRAPKGCALKIHSGGIASGDRAQRGRIDGVIGVDVGKGTAGNNRELLRLSHVSDIDIGYAEALLETAVESGQYALALVDATRVRVGALRGSFHAGIIIDDVLDVSAPAPAGPVTDILVESFTGTVVSSVALDINLTAQSAGNIQIRGIDIGGFTSTFAGITVGTYTGPIILSGIIRGSVFPGITATGAATADNFLVDMQWGEGRFAGRVPQLNTKAVQQWSVPSASSANVAANGLFLNALQATAGVGAYGGAVEFGRPASARRGAALVAKQTGAATNNAGLAIWTGPASVATDALTENFVFQHNAVLHVPNMPVFASNAAAISGGLVAGNIYKTVTGELRIVV